MVANVKDKAVIVGIGNTEFSKNSGVSELNLAIRAIKTACDDAGLHPSAIDGMVTFTMDTSDEIEVARALGVGELTFYGRAHYGGGAATGSLHQAVMAVATGMAETVVVYRALNGRSGHRFSGGVSGEITTADAVHWGWYMPYGLLTPASWVAMFTQRWMHNTGVTKDARYEVAKATRDYGANEQIAHGYSLWRKDVHIQLRTLVGVRNDIPEQHQRDGGRDDLAQGAGSANGSRSKRWAVATAQHDR